MSSSSELEVVGAPVVAVKRSQRRRQPARVRAAPLSPTARPSAPPRKRVDSAREIAAKRGIDGADVLDLDQDAVYELSESSDVEFVNLDPARSADKQVAAGPGHSHAAAPPTSITLSSDSSLVLPPFNSARPKTEPAVPLAGSVSQPAVLSSEGFAGPDVRSSSAPSTTGRPRPRPSPVKPKSRETVASDGSDVDDFFTRKPIVQAKRKPAGRRLPKASQSASTQNIRKAQPISSSSSSSSSSDTEGETVSRDPTMAAAVRPIKMPAWTVKSGAARRATLGGGLNRKKRRMSVDSDEEQPFGKDDPVDEGKQAAPVDSMLGQDKSRSPIESDARRAFMSAGASAAPQFAPRTSPRRISPPVRRPPTPPAPSSPSAPSNPPSEPETDQDEPLNPQMARIREMARRKAMSAALAPLEPNSSRRGEVGQPQHVEQLENNDEDVTLQVSLFMDPDRKASEAARRGYERPMHFTIKSREKFERIFQAISVQRTIPRAQLVLQYRKSIVYPFGTPKSLRIFGSATLQAYMQETWDKLKARNLLEVEAANNSRATSMDPSAADADAEGTSGDAVMDESQAYHDGGKSALEPPSVEVASDAFHITLRGSSSQTVAFAVKPSTSLSTLLQRYCRKFDIAPQRAAAMWLEFDGERLDLGKRIQDYAGEIEDDETVDVHEPRSYVA